jgi:hypothetical protein
MTAKTSRNTGRHGSRRGSYRMGTLAAAEPDQPQESCDTVGSSSTVCQTPGNAEINDAPPPPDFYPYGGEAGLL